MIASQLVAPCGRYLFSAHSSSIHRLKEAGFSNHAAKLSFLPACTFSQASNILNGVISLRPKKSKSTFELFDKGDLQLSRIPLKLNLRPKWSAHIEVGAIPPQQRQAIPVFALQEDSSKIHRLYSLDAVQAKNFSFSFSLTCPQCKQPRTSDKIQPATSTGSWTNITCPVDTCKHKSTSNKWWCNCGMPWRRCKKHSRWPEHANIFRAEAHHQPFLVLITARSKIPLPL